jgi:hypothetical protein
MARRAARYWIEAALRSFEYWERKGVPYTGSLGKTYIEQAFVAYKEALHD